MNAIRKWVDKFCYKHPKFGIPNLMRYFIIISALVYIAGLMDRTGTLFNYFLFNPQLILRGQIWRIVTWIFIPTTDFPFIIIELYFYFHIGSTIERYLGTGRFTFYYLTGVILNIIYVLIFMLVSGKVIIITALYLNLSLFFAYAVMFPENRFLLFFFIPVKVKWLALVDAAFMLYNMVLNAIAGNWLLAFFPLISILNFFIFFGDHLLYSAKRTTYGAFNSNTIKFKSAARKYQKQQEAGAGKTAEGKIYRHKCSVCGKTDADYPDLEFRYCSRCEGYHCFCMDHINNHVHFTE